MTTSPEHEEAGKHRSFKDEVAHAIGITGTAGTSAGTILAGTFVVRTLLIASIAVLLGRWNWWPSRLFSGTIQTAASGPHPRKPVAAEIREPTDA